MIKKTAQRISRKKIMEDVSCHVYTGRNIRINALYFDFKQGTTPDGKYYGGYKYLLAGSSKDLSKKELIDWPYKVVNNEITLVGLPDFIRFRFASVDTSRFKCSLSFNPNF